MVVTAEVGTATPEALPVTIPTDPMAPFLSEAASGAGRSRRRSSSSPWCSSARPRSDTTFPVTGVVAPSAVTVAAWPTFSLGTSFRLTVVLAS